MKLKYFIPAAIVLAGLVGATAVFANPFYTGTQAKTATATSTLTYMTPGLATTTIVYDSYEVNGTNQTNGGNLTVPDTASLALQVTASSTATIVNVAYEYSDDMVDWYANDYYNTATTTPGVASVTNPFSFTYTYASTTPNGAPVPSNARTGNKLLFVSVPTRYVRAVITNTGAGAGVWAAFIPKKQRN